VFLDGRKGKKKGYVLYSLYYALVSPGQSYDYAGGVRWVIQQGGDTDTNAAIAGGILALVYAESMVFQEENIGILERAMTTEEGNLSTIEGGIDEYMALSEENGFIYSYNTVRPDNLTYSQAINLITSLEKCFEKVV